MAMFLGMHDEIDTGVEKWDPTRFYPNRIYDENFLKSSIILPWEIPIIWGKKKIKNCVNLLLEFGSNKFDQIFYTYTPIKSNVYELNYEQNILPFKNAITKQTHVSYLQIPF